MEKQKTHSLLRFSILGMVALLFLTCNTREKMKNYPIVQLTDGPKGHTLHNTQSFSKDDQWIVYDTRNDESEIGATGSIEMVHTKTNEVKVLYQTKNQTAFGPGVGAATFSPTRDSVLFIHGIENANKDHPYGVTRRTGVMVDIHHPGKPIHMDARDIDAPFTKGALRGGTHAHTWSGDGNWISFTYNDYIMEQLAETDSAIKDLRTVGIMFPKPVHVQNSENNPEHISGQMFAVVIVEVTENPTPGSDGIEKAYDETWIGTDGYIKSDGSHQKRAIAFQGDVRDEKGRKKTEVFVVDLPEDLTRAEDGKPLEGTSTSRPLVPKGVKIRRITHLKKGIEGPRYWLRTTPDGSQIAFLQKDENDLVQIFLVSPNGGPVRQLTKNTTPIQGPFNFSPDGKKIAYRTDHSIFLTDLESGETERITQRFPEEERINDAPVWSNKGDQIAFSKYTPTEGGSYFQVFLINLEK